MAALKRGVWGMMKLGEMPPYDQPPTPNFSAPAIPCSTSQRRWLAHIFGHSRSNRAGWGKVRHSHLLPGVAEGEQTPRNKPTLVRREVAESLELFCRERNRAVYRGN